MRPVKSKKNLIFWIVGFFCISMGCGAKWHKSQATYLSLSTSPVSGCFIVVNRIVSFGRRFVYFKKICKVYC